MWGSSKQDLLLCRKYNLIYALHLPSPPQEPRIARSHQTPVFLQQPCVYADAVGSTKWCALNTGFTSYLSINWLQLRSLASYNLFFLKCRVFGATADACSSAWASVLAVPLFKLATNLCPGRQRPCGRPGFSLSRIVWTFGK